MDGDFLFLGNIQDDTIPAIAAHQSPVDRKQDLLPWAQPPAAVWAGMIDPVSTFILLPLIFTVLYQCSTPVLK
jgi:hypothetical protein